MKLRVCWIGKTKEAAIQSLSAEYVKRLAHYLPTDTLEASSEAALLAQWKKAAGRTRPLLVLLDGGGRQMSSEELASFLQQHQDRGTQAVWFAVGPADGFSDEARAAASFRLSLGKMTLAHDLARIVLLEQLYRACTILQGHPYHRGH